MSVYFRELNISELTDRYLEGDYDEKLLPLSGSRKRHTVFDLNEDKSFIIESAGRKYALLNRTVANVDGYYEISKNKDARCMQCLRKVSEGEEIPFGIPIAKEMMGDIKVYHCIDVFCNFGCRKTELNSRLGGEIYKHSNTLLNELFTLLTGLPIDRFRGVGDRRLLKIFNGPMSWKQYHSTEYEFVEDYIMVKFIPVKSHLAIC